MKYRKMDLEQRKRAIWLILISAQLAGWASGLLWFFWRDRFPFLAGILAGYSAVGNLFFLTQFRQLTGKTR